MLGISMTPLLEKRSSIAVVDLAMSFKREAHLVAGDEFAFRELT